MRIVVRTMCDEDARSFLAVHHAAVRVTAAKDYSPAVIEDWAPLPITEKDVAGFLSNPDSEIRLVAQIAGQIVGIGVLVVEKNELRACYVAPAAARHGVGLALVREIERIARNHRLAYLQLDSSVTAEAFYSALGYATLERGQHVLASGQRMTCIKMKKRLAPH